MLAESSAFGAGQRSAREDLPRSASRDTRVHSGMRIARPIFPVAGFQRVEQAVRHMLNGVTLTMDRLCPEPTSRVLECNEWPL
jgi:hypothetical protein